MNSWEENAGSFIEFFYFFSSVHRKALLWQCRSTFSNEIAQEFAEQKEKKTKLIGLF